MEINDQDPDSLWNIAWKKLKKDKLAMAGLLFILFVAAVSILGGIIRPDSSKYANTQNLSLAQKHPGFSVQMLEVNRNMPAEPHYFWENLFFGGSSTHQWEQPVYDFHFAGDSVVFHQYSGSDTVAGAREAYHMLDVLFALDLNSIQSEDSLLRAKTLDGDWVQFSVKEAKSQILSRHITQKTFLLGTDKFGRDMLSRLMAGSIVSLSVGFISVLISLCIGIPLGAIGGYFGGAVDEFIMWLINVIWSIPTLLLVIAITFALGKGFTQVFVAVGLTMWVEVARVVRGQVLSIRQKEFVEAGRALGYTAPRIIVRHVLPNTFGPVIVISAANFASAILMEAGLSFLGIGAQIPMASWGQMIKEHYAYITTDLAYLAILPGLCIILLVLAFMLLGNGLRDALDNRSFA